MAKGTGLRKTLAAKFDDELKFFKGWIDKPKAVGAIVPTSSVTARRMASVIDLGSGLPVLELGPGTGVITKAILRHGVKPENLYAVEYSADFARHLRNNFPGVNVIEGDAFNLDTTLGKDADLTFDAVISGVWNISTVFCRACRKAGPWCRSPTARCHRYRPAVATTRSSISISSCAISRRHGCGSTAAARTDFQAFSFRSPAGRIRVRLPSRDAGCGEA
jgi:SAM-dependent methyltransferase